MTVWSLRMPVGEGPRVTVKCSRVGSKEFEDEKVRTD